MEDDPVQEALNRAAAEVTPEDRKRVIAKLRQQRALIASGGKAKKEKEVVDISKLGIEELKPKITMKGRRF